MEFTGKVEQVLQMESGEGKKGTWKKQGVIFQHGTDKYPKKTRVDFSGDLADTVFKVGDDMKLEVDTESREYNGKWYTDVKAWKIK